MEARINNLLEEHKKHDKSFLEKPSLFSVLYGERKYNQSEVREIWFSGIKLGIGIGLENTSVEGQKIEIYKSTTTDRQREFVEKFYALSKEYNCAIEYHPLHGMMIVDKDYRFEP